VTPTSRNSASAGAGPIFGYTQGIPAPSVTSSRLYVTAMMGADPGATATLRVTSLWADGRQTMQEIRQGPVPASVFRRDVVMLPPGKTLLAVMLTLGVEGTGGSAYFKNVSISPAVPATWLEANGTPDSGVPLEATISVNAASKVRHIPTTLFGSNLEWPWDGMGVWDTARAVPNATVVSLTNKAGITMHRFPGGLYADFYDWRKGVGPQGQRPWASPLPGMGQSQYTFGTDEALQFAQSTNSDLLITVNAVTDTPESAAEWVRYVNAQGTRVKYWEIGNESYSEGYSTDGAADQYAARFLQFAQAMRAVDPNIKLGAIAEEEYGHTVIPVHPGWTDRVLTLAGSQIDFIAAHCGYAPLVFDDKGWDVRTVYAAQLAAPKLIADQLASLAARINKLVPNRAANISIAVTEWGPLFQTDPASRFVDHPKTVASALFTASALKTFIESSKTEIANFFKLVDLTFEGAIGLRQGVFAEKASLLAMQMFRQHFGSELVTSQVSGPGYDSPAVGWVDPVSNAPYLDSITSSSADGKTLYVMGINKHFERGIHTHVSLAGYAPQASARVYTLNAPAADSNTNTDMSLATGVNWAKQAQIQPNSRFYNSNPADVGIQQSTFNNVGTSFDYTFPAHSVTVIAIDAR
jgi:alpha-N-arabinofuranosidase